MIGGVVEANILGLACSIEPTSGAMVGILVQKRQAAKPSG